MNRNPKLNVNIESIIAEHGPLDELAKECTPPEFSERTKGAMRLWGYPIPKYVAVTLGHTDYLWRLDSATYDGWNEHFTENDVQ